MRTIKVLMNGLAVIVVLSGFWWVGSMIVNFEGFGYRTETYETKSNLKGFGVPDFVKRGDKLRE